jgi:CheY-like chemotaxis protein
MAPNSRRNWKILLVEDEFLIASLLQRLLGNLGCGVSWVGNVDDATQLASVGKFDGAVLDINLSGEKVFPVCDALRARGIPFVFTTAYETSSLPRDYADYPVISKPIVRENVALAVDYFRQVSTAKVA